MNSFSKIITLFAIITLVGFTSIQETSNNIGYINSSEIMNNMPEIQQANEYYKLYEIQQNQIIEESSTEYNRLEELYYANTDDSKADILQSQLRQHIEEHKALEKKIYEDLKTKHNDLMTPIIDKINLEINKLAKQNNYQIVLDSDGQVLYAEDSINMTDALKSNLGM